MKKNRLINVYWQKINILNGVREKVILRSLHIDSEARIIKWISRWTMIMRNEFNSRWILYSSIRHKTLRKEMNQLSCSYWLHSLADFVVFPWGRNLSRRRENFNLKPAWRGLGSFRLNCLRHPTASKAARKCGSSTTPVMTHTRTHARTPHITPTPPPDTPHTPIHPKHTRRFT